mmetsp:Transcript_74709/g.194819  ORF Transcript_74709/g.194819 Transcript_74709/m.194819 type:complete len:202 (+) Transcript_74709:1758-2363(+)
MARMRVSEHDAPRDLAGLQRLEHQLVLALAPALDRDRGGPGDVDQVALHLERGGARRVVPHHERMGGPLAGLALDDDLLLGERLLRDAVQVVLVGLVGARVVKHQLGLDITHPVGPEHQRVVRGGGLAVCLPLLRHEVSWPVELVAALREDGLDLPLALRRVHDRNLLRQVLPRLGVEGEEAVRVWSSAGALDLVDPDVHI